LPLVLLTPAANLPPLSLTSVAYWPPASTTPVVLAVHLEKFEMTLLLFSGAWGKVIHEKNLKQKIS
jgi:hypothetical protein